MCEGNNCACATKEAGKEMTHEGHGESCNCQKEGGCKCKNGEGTCERPIDIENALKKSMDCTCKDGVCECEPKEDNA